MKISEMITDRYKMRIPPTIYYDLLADVQELEEEQEPTTKNELGVDCISRVQAQTEIEMNASRYTIAKERGGMGQVEWSDQLIKISDAVNIIRNLPSVTPQAPRKGHWIRVADKAGHLVWECDKCGWQQRFNTNYCPDCGADMRGEEE